MRPFTVLLCLLAAPVLADQTLRSPVQQATVLELYTSEGCSSCPPADRWLSGMLDHPSLWQTLIPVAFHVDYWNYLGWEDRFATPAYGERQREYRRQGISNGVYTPGVMAGGDEWRSWRRRPDQVPLSKESVGVLELAPTGQAFEALFVPVAGTPGANTLHIAVLGFGMSTPVRAGENKGRELKHDFVVLGHRTFRGSAGKWSGKLPSTSQAGQAERLALVAWVSADDRLGPIQAVGGWWQ
ncbi:MAG: DUF1223 domain-containing protein [Halioglobus sp.]